MHTRTVRLVSKCSSLSLSALSALFAVAFPAHAQTDLGAMTESASVRVAAIGDFGSASDKPNGEAGSCLVADGCPCHWYQQQATDALAVRHTSKPFGLGLTVGDNFYPSGVKSTSHKHWKCSWKRFYGRLGLVFYPSLGNHDYGGFFSQGSPDAQVAYSGTDQTWNMPARYYTFQAGPIQFFALDTVKFTEEQIDWLDNALDEKADAKWKVVYGHHPVYSCSKHKDTKRLIKKLLPLLAPEGGEPRVDAYVSGHDHDLQYIAMNRIDFFVSGGGGRENSSRPMPIPSGCSSRVRKADGLKFGSKRNTYGHLEIEADESSLNFRIVDQTGETLWETN